MHFRTTIFKIPQQTDIIVYSKKNHKIGIRIRNSLSDPVNKIDATISFQFDKYLDLKKKYQFQIATVLFLASAALAAPQYYYQPGNQYYYQPGYGPGYGYGNYQPQQAYRPQSLNTFRYAQNPLRSAPLQSPTVRGTGLDSLSGK